MRLISLLILTLLFSAPFMGTSAQAQEQNRVVYLLPDMDLVSKVPRNKFDVFYVLPKKEYEENKGRFKNVPAHRLCLLLLPKAMDEIRKCMDKFSARLKGGKFQYLVNGASEEEVMMAGVLRSEYGVENGMSKEEAEIFVDKYKMKLKLQKMNPEIPTAKFLNLMGRDTLKKRKTIGKLNLPIIFKPTDKAGSEGVEIVRDQKELDLVVMKIKRENPNGEYIVEEFIEGPVMRIDGFVVKGKVQVAYPSYYNPSCYLYYRQGAPQVTHSDFAAERKAEYESFTQAIITALELQEGPYHLEAIRSSVNGKLYFLEIGARPGGDSEFLTNFYNYPYDDIHVRSQVGLASRPKLVPHTGKNGFAIVDCPSLPPVTGKRQRLEEFSYNDKQDYKGICENETYILDKGDVMEVDDVVSTMATFMFNGPEKTILREAKRLRDSTRAVLTVWDEPTERPSKRAKKVKWPLTKVPDAH